MRMLARLLALAVVAVAAPAAADPPIVVGAGPWIVRGPQVCQASTGECTNYFVAVPGAYVEVEPSGAYVTVGVVAPTYDGGCTALDPVDLGAVTLTGSSCQVVVTVTP